MLQLYIKYALRKQLYSSLHVIAIGMDVQRTIAGRRPGQACQRSCFTYTYWLYNV